LYDNSESVSSINIDHVSILHASWPYWDYDSLQQKSSIGQVIQQNHCLWKYCPKFLALIDLDEYINPHKFNLFDDAKSVLAIPCYFFNVSQPFSLEESILREDKKNIHLSYDKCIVHSPTVDLFCVHIPISFKNIYYANYTEVQLNHYNDRKKGIFSIPDYSILDHVHQFDVVIPVGPLDQSIIHEQIKYTKKNIIGHRNIYLICSDPTTQIDGCITVDETIFPFNMTTVSNYHGKIERNGWYLQQLLKLYAGNVISGISERYLVIDADTVFIKPTSFIEKNKCLYNFGTEYHKPYFEHMKRLYPEFIKCINVSGICNHMMFEKKYINEMFTRIENIHHDLFYHIFLKMVTDTSGAGASEYEMYFNYMLNHHKDEINIRRLPWKIGSKIHDDAAVNYMSIHWHIR
jgi:hypothetical protein